MNSIVEIDAPFTKDSSKILVQILINHNLFRSDIVINGNENIYDHACIAAYSYYPNELHNRTNVSDYYLLNVVNELSAQIGYYNTLDFSRHFFNLLNAYMDNIPSHKHINHIVKKSYNAVYFVDY